MIRKHTLSGNAQNADYRSKITLDQQVKSVLWPLNSWQTWYRNQRATSAQLIRLIEMYLWWEDTCHVGTLWMSSHHRFYFSLSSYRLGSCLILSSLLWSPVVLNNWWHLYYLAPHHMCWELPQPPGSNGRWWPHHLTIIWALYPS